MTECERQSGVLARWHNRRSLGRRAGSVALDRDALMVSSLAGDHHMAFKLTKAERTAVVATLPAAVAARKGLEQAIETYNAAIADLRRQIETIAHAWQDTFDQRSERWQDSNAGIDARTAIEAWDELAEALEDVDLELPDLELPDAN